MRGGLLAGLLLALAAQAQLIPTGSPVPVTTLPPVVFINGYQFDGCPTTFADTFGIADQVLQSNGQASLFFSTCSLASSATIEDLAAAFATFLNGLQYTNGQPVQTVDVVAHSMGGLVLRSYLSGKQNKAGVFQPPAATHVRKAVFLATPNFGTPIVSLVASLLPVSAQLEEMQSGGSFPFALGTWNDGTDDLRGVDAIAAAGNAGTGVLSGTAGFDDGVVPLTSGSLRFYLAGRTRVVPYCHIDGGGIISVFNLCPSSAQGIADINSPMHDSAQMIVSFFNGTDTWQSVGTAAENDPFLSVDGGLIVQARSGDDSTVNINSATAGNPTNVGTQKLSISPDGIAFTDQIPAGAVLFGVNAGSMQLPDLFLLPAGGIEPYIVKPGPLIARVFPAAAANFPLELAPRMIVAIYGSNLASATVSTGASPLTLDYVSATQINAVLPDNVSGLTPITVQNSDGQNTVNIYVGAAAPAIFTQDFSGAGPASALKATDQSLVTADNPLHVGDSVELFAAGLGLTSSSNGLDVAVQQPTVTVGGVACPVTFAGAAPGFMGLDQINCTIPSGIASSASVPVIVTSGDRTSNTATLAIAATN